MKVDISSTAVEKGIDLAKDFLDKLISPAIEETGLLIKDQIASWRFKNQIKTLNRAQEFCEKHNIKPKEISFKLICPLLEYASLEEDEKLQDKWAILISNLVDSEQNIENHVFPYILSQISLNEYDSLEKSFLEKQVRVNKLKKELEISKIEYPSKEKEIIENIEKHKEDIFSKWKYEKELRELKDSENKILNLIKEPESLNDSDIKEFEISNLVRLGLIKNIIEHYIHSQPITIPSRNEYEYEEDIKVDLEIGIDQDYEYYNLTELGELFISACTEKNKL
ncbi:DUF4393 domain-containing protein [Flavobacterium sp. I-SCBP12n]|uniref:DUF4393 domain-containing protein n=1 Tax=Flavobacterium pygoscelis TaxID=2893176 RepID=A0A9X1XSD5_9FLAO|nr:Abi-alpha family protein [Flavobacterium pygoscelis]MCK8142905.1 DUF4393 domain-containing protein [Flavobacterium pygoscelis]